MDELREAREQGENMSRKLNQDLEDRCVELQDAREQISALEEGCRKQGPKNKSPSTGIDYQLIYQLTMLRISPRSSSDVSGQENIL